MGSMPQSHSPGLSSLLRNAAERSISSQMMTQVNLGKSGRGNLAWDLLSSDILAVWGALAGTPIDGKRGRVHIQDLQLFMVFGGSCGTNEGFSLLTQEHGGLKASRERASCVSVRALFLQSRYLSSVKISSNSNHLVCYRMYWMWLR